MNELESKEVSCPYCGELIELQIDCSVLHQDYIEDCHVCCRPINIHVTIDDNDAINVNVASEDE